MICVSSCCSVSSAACASSKSFLLGQHGWILRRDDTEPGEGGRLCAEESQIHDHPDDGAGPGILIVTSVDRVLSAPARLQAGSWRYRYDFRKAYDTYMKPQGYGGVTAHDMRRSFASNRVSAGVSIEKVANWLGDTIQVAWKNYSRFLPVDRDINLGAA